MYDDETLVVSSLTEYFNAVGGIPPSHMHWARVVSGIDMATRKAINHRVLSKFLFIGTEFGYE